MARDNVIVIEHERALIEYLYERLNKGITNGVTSEEYFEFINALVEKINSSESEFAITAKIENESFSDIAEKAKEITKIQHWKDEIWQDGYGIDFSSTEFGKGIIYPNYDLVKKSWNDYKLFRSLGYPQQITRDFLEKTIEAPNLSSYSLKQVSDKNFQVSKKIAALYVNELIKRYIKTRVEKKYWPIQCRDIDKYIFDRNIAALIDEKGTAETFKIAYLQAIRVIAEMKESNSSEYIMFSNNEANVLAYANYLKMIAPKQLEFLRSYEYNQYELHNASIDITTYGDVAEFKTSACNDYDPYGGWSDTYNHESGVINDGPVLVMEKRIGKILK